MAKRKSTKEETMIYNTLHRKLKSAQHVRHLNRGHTQVLRLGEKILLHYLLAAIFDSCYHPVEL
jgi:hypothetical protein